MPLLVVRHAHAGRRSAYQGDDHTRPLSKRGIVQARALVPLLTEYRPQRILSSPYVRCCETVLPTARALGLPVEAIGELAEGHGGEAVALLRRMAGESAVLCIHGDVALEVLEALGGPSGGAATRLQKGEVWVVQSTGSRSAGSRLAIVSHLRPGTAPSPAAG